MNEAMSNIIVLIIFIIEIGSFLIIPLIMLIIEIIKKRRNQNKKLTDKYLVQRDLINPDFLKDYISKDKIKAIIKELDYGDYSNFERRCKQEVLQSLLERSK